MNTLNELLVHPIFQRLGWTLVHSIWQGAAIAFLAVIAMAMLKRQSSQARYVVSCAGMLLMLVGLVVTFFILPGPILRPDVVMTSDTPPVQATAVMLAPIHVAPVIQTPPPLTLIEKLQQFLPACAAFWIIGIALMSIRHVGGWMRVQQLRKHATRLTGEPWDALMSHLCETLRVKRAVAIAESALVQVPSVIGYLKPVILLPACAISGLSPQQLEGLIAHELAHVRRHDYLVNLLQIVIETLLFYHPAAWWLSKRIRQERENCCDDLAASVCGNRVAYVQALAAMEELRMVPGELVLGARGGNLLPRVRRLLGVETPRQRNWSLTAAIVVVIIALVPLLIAQRKATAAEAAPATKPNVTATQPSETTAFPIDANHESAIDKKLPEVNFSAIAFSDVVDFFRDVTGANLFVDWKAIEAAGLSKDAPVTLRVRDVSFGKALQLVLDSVSDANAKLAFTLDENVIQIGVVKPTAGTPQAAHNPHQPATSGTGTFGIEKPRESDPQLKALLEKKLPEVNFSDTPFSDTIDFLRDITGTNVFVNWKALEAAGIDKNESVTLRVRNVSFGKVLDLLLQSAGGSVVQLTYEADQGVISITTATAATATSPPGVTIQAAGGSGEKPFDPAERYAPEEIRNLTMEQRMALRRYAEQHPATQPLYRAVRIVVGAEKMTLDGKETTWDKAKEELAKLPNRGDLVLEVAVASDQMTLKQHQEAVGRGMQLAAQLSFKYVSDVGVHPLGSKAGDETDASTQPGADASRAGEYYVSGAVKRGGVYSLTGRNIKLKQALIAADVDPKAKFVRLIRSEGGQPETVRDTSIADLMNGQVEDSVLHFNDQLIVSETQQPAPEKQSTAIEVPGKMPIGEYYIGGHVKRPGVYSTTGRHISVRQALIAAGGVDDDGKNVSLFRRSAAGKDEDVLSVAVSDIFTPGSQHNLYLQPDDTLMVTLESGAAKGTTKP